MPDPIHQSANFIDLGPRVFLSNSVAGSPATNAETTVCTLTLSGDLLVTKGVLLFGWAAMTVGTSGTAVTAKLRQTGTSGTTIATTGATTGGIAATNLIDINVQGTDTALNNGAATTVAQVYVLTITVTGGAATSTVSAASLFALVV